MAFDSLSDRLQLALKKVKGQTKLTEQNIDDMLREIRLALLEADVNFKVVKSFIAEVKQQALGQDVLNSLTPSQMIVKIVNDALCDLLGHDTKLINFNNHGITVIMMVGLQGAGKTTTVGKLAKSIIEQDKKKPLLVACDIYRPAAINQLETVAKQVGAGFYSFDSKDVSEIASNGLKFAKENDYNVVIVDTAGRLHIDDALMEELTMLESNIKPNETLLVVDSLTGQDAVNVASTFNEKLKITGAVLTKLDGDSRGGAALSIVHMTQIPIKYIGTGEKMEALDIFHPDRMADRILGMGDVLTLIEKASNVLDEKKSQKAVNRMMDGSFDLDDMLEQMQQIKKLGSMSGIMKMMPGMPKMEINDEDANRQLKKTESIIQSMTLQERKNPKIIKAKRKERIAKGSGRKVSEVNSVLTQHENMKKQMQSLSKMMNSQNMGNMGNLNNIMKKFGMK